MPWSSGDSAKAATRRTHWWWLCSHWLVSKPSFGSEERRTYHSHATEGEPHGPQWLWIQPQMLIGEMMLTYPLWGENSLFSSLPPKGTWQPAGRKHHFSKASTVYYSPGNWVILSKAYIYSFHWLWVSSVGFARVGHTRRSKEWGKWLPSTLYFLLIIHGRQINSIYFTIQI